MVSRDVRTHLYIRTEADLLVQAQQVTLEAIVLQDPFLIRVTQIDIGRGFLPVIGNAQVVVRKSGIPKYQVLPVGIGCVIRVIKSGGTQIGQLGIVQFPETVGIRECNAVLHRLYPIGCLQVDPRLSPGSLFGSDGDHTIRPAKAVDGDRGRIPQHIDRLNIGRIQEVDIIMQDPIHHKDRTGTVGTVHPADADDGCSTCPAGIGDRQSRHLALQRCDRVGGRHPRDLVPFYGTHRPRQIATTLGAESNHHHFVDLAL